MLQKSNTLATLEVFFNEPTKSHYLIEIARKIFLAHTSVKKNLEILEKEGLIQKIIEKRGLRNFPEYIAKTSSDAYKKEKILSNLRIIFSSGIISAIEKETLPKCIVLFGSYARGEDTEDSDIDIFVEAAKKDLSLSKFETKLKRKVEIHYVENFSDYPKELRNNILNGIVLQGYLEAIQ